MLRYMPPLRHVAHTTRRLITGAFAAITRYAHTLACHFAMLIKRHADMLIDLPH